MWQDPRSTLALYRTLLALRRREAALHAGSIEAVDALGDCLVFDRVSGTSRLRVLINFGTEAIALPAGEGGHPIVFSSEGFTGATTGEAAPPGAAAADREPTGLLPPLVARILRV